MQLTKTLMPVLLAASATAAPRPNDVREDRTYLNIAEKQANGGGVEKRQFKELLEFAGPVVDKLIDKVFNHLDSAAEDSSMITRQIQGKATNFAIIGDEKKVAPRWLEDGLLPKVANMTAAEEGSLVSSTYPNAMMSQKWAARQNGDDGGHDGDWVDVDVAWSQIPNFNGEHVEMSRTLFEEILQYGMDISSSGNPARTQGFHAVYNREWGVLVDITNIDDSEAESAYGPTYDWINN